MPARNTCILGLFTLMAGCTHPVPGPAPLTLDPVLNKYDGGGDGGGCAGGADGRCRQPLPSGP